MGTQSRRGGSSEVSDKLRRGGGRDTQHKIVHILGVRCHVCMHGVHPWRGEERSMRGKGDGEEA
eukprot:9298603-Prorocentrum_lima.AAC.1